MNPPPDGIAPWAQFGFGLHLKRIGSEHPGFNAFILRGRSGPVAVINGATHGDEYEGPTVIRELIAIVDPGRLHGTLVLIPVLHEDAFFAGTRCHPKDGSNLARVFPGDSRGNQAERVAALFLGQVLRHANYYLDLHSGGVLYDLLPWTGYIRTGRPDFDQKQASMAACFDKFWCWVGLGNPGRTISTAVDNGIPAVYTENRGGAGVHPDDVRDLHRGLRNFLLRFGFLKGPMPRLKKQSIRQATDRHETTIQLHHPSPAAGLFTPAVSVGEKVRKGALVGIVYPLGKKTGLQVKATHPGTVVSLRRKRSVARGDALASLVVLFRPR
jgi:predicted deacylase